VKLQIGAISDEAKLKFLRALENSPAFREVREDRENVVDPQPIATIWIVCRFN